MNDDAKTPDTPRLSWPGLPVCRFCQTPLTPAQSKIGRCDDPLCLARHRNERHRLRYRLPWNRHVASQRAGLEDHGAKIVAGARALGRAPGDVAVGVVPYLDRPLEPVPDYQRKALIAHIRQIVRDAFHRADPGPFPVQRPRNEAPEPARGTAACIACQGHCCVLGLAANAFLRVETIDHVRRHHPDLTPDQIVERYAQKIPDRSVRDACAFQGQMGCTLDRTWRADMCNNFQCNGKRQALDRAEGDAPILWIATEDGRGRAMLHDRAGIRQVQPDPADAVPAAVAKAVAAVQTQVPRELPDNAPRYAHACRRCGTPISAERAAETGTCTSSACDLAGRHGRVG